MRSAPLGPRALGAARGFSIIELLVVTVPGSLILIVAYSVLAAGARSGAADVQTQAGRAGMELLFSELRELSPEGGDLVHMDRGSVTIRVMSSAALICDSSVVAPGSYRWELVPLGDALAVGDSVWLFAERDRAGGSQDVWFRSRVVSVEGTGTCGGQPAQTVEFRTAAETPTIGGLVRTYDTYSYGLGEHLGSAYLMRTLEPDGDPLPLVGPLRSSTGVTFSYLDKDGVDTSVAAAVRQIVVTLRTSDEARDAVGDLVKDSLQTRVYTRN